MFIPKFFQSKSKEPAFKCVGTTDGDASDSDCDTLFSYQSLSNINEDEAENIEKLCHSLNSDLFIVKKIKPFPDCCTSHFIESSHGNYENPSKQELMKRRLELYFKKYSSGLNNRDFNEIISDSPPIVYCGKIRHIDNTLNLESVKTIKFLPPYKGVAYKLYQCDKRLSILKLTTRQEIEKPIFMVRIDNYYKMNEEEENNVELPNWDPRNMSRNLSRITTRSSQDIFYSAESNDFSVEDISFEDNQAKSEKTLNSLRSTSFTTCLNVSSNTYCEEIEKLNLNSNNSITEPFYSSRFSLNSTMTSCYNDVSIPSRLDDQIITEPNDMEFDHVTSLTDRRNAFSSDHDFTNVSEIFINPISEFTMVSSVKSILKNKPKKTKHHYNEIFEKYLSIITCRINDPSSSESSEWSSSRMNKSSCSLVSKLPRKYKKSISTCVSDLGSFDLYSYLSSFDKSESCLN